jgi:hypothetical protein
MNASISSSQPQFLDLFSEGMSFSFMILIKHDVVEDIMTGRLCRYWKLAAIQQDVNVSHALVLGEQISVR